MKITVLRSHATPQIEMWQDENSCGAAGSLDTSVFVRHILHGSGRQATVSIYCSSFLYTLKLQILGLISNVISPYL